MKQIMALLLVLAGLAGGVEIGPVEPAADQETRDWQVWETMITNRDNLTGPIFYVRRTAEGPDIVRLRFQSRGLQGRLSDGQPANLVLRIFGPDDRSITARVIGQPDTRIYEVAVDLRDAPAGRYRLALVGHLPAARVDTEPAAPVGVIGGGPLGLQAPGEWYLNVPPDVEKWTLRAVGVRTAPTLTLTPPVGEPVSGELNQVPRPDVHNYTEFELDGVPGEDRVWRLTLEGQGQTSLVFVNVPGILWPTAEAAAIADYDYVGARRINHEWQRPLAEWLAARTAADFALPEIELPRPDWAAMPAEELYKLVHYTIWHHGVNTAISLMRHNQIVDPANPALGLFVENPATDVRPLNLDGASPHNQIHYARGLAGLYLEPMDGLNPWAGNPILRNRVYAAIFQLLLMIPEGQYATWDFVNQKFWGQLMPLFLPDLPEDLAEAVRAGLIERFSRDLYFDGYVSNQGLNVLAGLHGIAEATGDPVLGVWFERVMTAFLNDQYRWDNHGQTAAGYYQEVGGFDGAYNTYSAQVLIDFWRRTGEQRYFDSLVRNFELIRHLAVTTADGRLTSARQWNTRTDSNAFRWHDHSAGGDIPGCATFLLRYGDDYRYTTDAARIAAELEQKWPHVYPAALDNRKYWSGGGFDYDRRVPYAEPLPLGCEEPGPWIRPFGINFLAWRRGPWYAVLYGGDIWCAGDSGSGLATLWHEDFGPLLCGDTRIDHPDKPELPLSFADLWEQDGKPTGAVKWQGVFTPAEDETAIRVGLAPRQKPPVMTRTYAVEDGAFTSTAELTEGEWAGHAVIFPLVAGPAIALHALDAEGRTLAELPEETTVLAGWRWTLEGRTIELRYEQPVPTTVIHPAERAGLLTLVIVRADFGAAPGVWTLR